MQFTLYNTESCKQSRCHKFYSVKELRNRLILLIKFNVKPILLNCALIVNFSVSHNESKVLFLRTVFRRNILFSF